MKIIFIINKEKTDIKKSNKFLKIYYRKKINIEEVKNIIKNGRKINKKNKIITIEGENKKEKLILGYLISKKIKNKDRNRILIVNFKTSKKDIPYLIKEKIMDNKKLIEEIEENIFIITDFNLLFNLRKWDKNLFQKYLSQIKNKFNTILINIEKNKKFNFYNRNLLEQATLNYLILNLNIKELKKYKKNIKKYSNNKMKIIINKKINNKINNKILNKIIEKDFYRIKLDEKNKVI